ncbi:hypothetical protein LRS13_06555 [Svornostia abyssi]|jgi:hypothetical protein|uniref:Uncharacterized protein n=1 Tax=Svornostia abyssi TaxID=2898438 RepID=A0ABY5PKI9_9ACTN|nr:hypothetical protein LRS13_06555 [Parviterribacteraceae bacterium J379]
MRDAIGTTSVEVTARFIAGPLDHVRRAAGKTVDRLQRWCQQTAVG